jgi:acetyl-CoA synthetase
VHDLEGQVCPPGITGHLMVRRRDGWIPTKDLARTDEVGYYYHGGRADDVIISAGWTMSAVEIENALLMHPDVLEAAAIGVPDDVRGQVVKAFVVSDRTGSDAFTAELQELVRTKLSQHEYPRHVAFVAELPKTPAGKVHRKVLRERELAAGAAVH